MTPRDRRALIAGATLAALAMFGLRIGPWLWRRSHDALEQLHARTALLVRLRTEVGRTRSLEDSAAIVRARLLTLAPKVLAAGTPSEATAALTGQLTALAEHYRVRLDRTDAVPDSLTVHDLERVTIRSAIEGDTRGTLDFLGALATALPVLSLDEVRVAAPNPGSAGTAPEILRTELTVHGWYLHREAHR